MMESDDKSAADDRSGPEWGVDESSEIARANIDAILRFLTRFEAPRFKFGHWDKTGPMPYHFLGKQASRFYQSLYKNGWIVYFDWMSWDQGRRLFEESPHSLATADLATVRRLLTAHVRFDRFCEGHLGSVFDSGHLTAILRRIRQLRDQMG